MCFMSPCSARDGIPRWDDGRRRESHSSSVPKTPKPRVNLKNEDKKIDMEV